MEIIALLLVISPFILISVLIMKWKSRKRNKLYSAMTDKEKKLADEKTKEANKSTLNLFFLLLGVALYKAGVSLVVLVSLAIVLLLLAMIFSWLKKKRKNFKSR